MDPDIKDLLEKNLALNEENNRMLRGLRRANRFAFVWKVIYLGIFLGGAVYAYRFLEPYYTQAKGMYASTMEMQTKMNDTYENIKKYLPR